MVGGRYKDIVGGGGGGGGIKCFRCVNSSLTPMGSSDLIGASSTGDGGRGGTAGATG